jgi:transcription initiation factor TFIIH subunit 2
MGFPSRTDEPAPSLCACHGKMVRGGYGCPRCRAKVCALPQACPACALTLVLSTHLARSYHHLFPLRRFREVTWARARAARSLQCRGCLRAFPPVPVDAPAAGDGGGKGPAVGASLVEGSSESARYECEVCHSHFCVDCDVFCHQVLFNCPGCLSGPPLGAPEEDEEEARGGDAMDGVERT